jgi:integrase
MARGSVRKHDGGWGIPHRSRPDPATGKRRQASRQGFATNREAETALRDLTSSMRDGVVPTRSVRTLGDFLDEWMELQRDRLRPTTWHSYGIAVTRIRAGLGRSKLQALAPLQLEHFYAELLASGGRTGTPLSPKTVRNTHTVLRKALADAERPGLVGRNPAAAAMPPANNRVEQSTWSSGELRAFLESVRSDRLQAAFVLLATTGMCRGEVLGLRWSDLELDGGALAVSNTLTTVGTDVVRRCCIERSRIFRAADPIHARRVRLNRANGVTSKALRPGADSKINSRWLNATATHRPQARPREPGPDGHDPISGTRRPHAGPSSRRSRRRTSGHRRCAGTAAPRR